MPNNILTCEEASELIFKPLTDAINEAFTQYAKTIDQPKTVRIGMAEITVNPIDPD